MSYKSCGVDIGKGNTFVKQIKNLADSTKGSAVLTDIGSFSGLFQLGARRYKDPVLVASTDGVGTKLMIAQTLDMHDGVGHDLVGMCANDVATTGAQPMFFLDYIATGKLKISRLKKVVQSISKACSEAGYALIGGETAEMPGMYKPGEYDLAGFCVGIVDRKNIIDGSSIKKGDLVLGIESNGIHSNGCSLVRKVLSKKELLKHGKELLKPTRLYTKPLLALGGKIKIKGIAHITGGAYVDKIPRILPKGLGIEITKGSWPMPGIFKLIQKKGSIKESEMYRVFNMGIGMVVVLSPKDIKKSQHILSKFKLKSWLIGRVVQGKRHVKLV
ncbi:phosphoribosylformylglycinamidine cyclo-ligase [Candidatus Omnitrophota bacterium]